MNIIKLFRNKKEKKKYFIFVLLIFFINFFLVFNYLDGFFLSDEFFFIALIRKNINPFTNLEWRYYRPIPLLIFNINYSLFGLNPIPFHLTSFIMNSFNTILFLLICQQIFKNQLVPFFTTIIYIGFYGLYFEILLWIACYFDLFLIFFLLWSIFFFIKSYKEEKKRTLYFFLSGIFVNLAFISKETAIFIIPAYISFDFLQEQKLKTFLKKSWKYIIFIPIIVFLIFRLNTPYTPVTFNFWHYFLLLIAGIISFLLILKLRKKTNQNEIFFYLLTLYSCFSLIFNINYRMWNFPAIGLSCLISFKLFGNFDFKFLEIINKLRNINYLITKKWYIIGITTFFSGSFILYGIANYSFNIASKSTLNISNKIISDNISGKIIYIVNVPYFPLVFALHEYMLEQCIYTISNNRIELNYLLVNDENFYKSGGHLYYGAELISIEEYNVITQNSLNQVYLFDISILNIRNISNIDYDDW